MWRALQQRVLSLGLTVLLGGLLGLARTLQPAPGGYGTHQQLGLPPCTSIALWGTPCPACGMTTAWAWFTRGAWWPAWQANAGGCLLALIALAYISISCYSLVCVRAAVVDRTAWVCGVGVLLAVLLSCGQWAIRWYLSVG